MACAVRHLSTMNMCAWLTHAGAPVIVTTRWFVPSTYCPNGGRCDTMTCGEGERWERGVREK